MTSTKDQTHRAQWRLAGWINFGAAVFIAAMQILLWEQGVYHQPLWLLLLWSSGENFGVGFLGLWLGRKRS